MRKLYKQLFNKNKKILITGATGMVGSALYKKLTDQGFNNIIAPGINYSRRDLTNETEVKDLILGKKPDYVFMLAAKVGGIQANIDNPVKFLDSNLRININVFKYCNEAKVEKCLFLGSSCIYPKECKQPMKEKYLMSGPLEDTNEGYALSKIVGLKLAQYYYTQYAMKTVCLMPCNVYGTGDNYDLKNSHVLSALIRRFVEAKKSGKRKVTLWGTGTPRREFMHVGDVVDAMIYLFPKIDSPEIVNIGTGKDLTIRKLAQTIAKEVGYKGKIEWDITKPNGMMKKCLAVSKMKKLGFNPQIYLAEGIRRSVKEYREKCNG